MCPTVASPLVRPNVPPVSVESNANEVSSLNLSSAPPLSLPDHDYTPVHPDPASSLLSPAPTCQLSERKRARSEEQQRVTSSDTDGAGTGVNQTGKRVRKPSQKARALQEAANAKVTPGSSPFCLSPLLSLTHPLIFISGSSQEENVVFSL